MHALQVLESAEVFESLDDALNDVQNAWASSARAGRNHSVTRALVPLHALPDPTTYDEPIALVFGRESSGLTNEEVDLCSLGFNIPTSREYQSMNLSHAVGVTLYHLYTSYAPEEPRQPTEARVSTRE